MFTRRDYLDADDKMKAHERYYGELVEVNGGPHAFRFPVSLDKIKTALASGDYHLNTIKLSLWDTYALPVSAKVAKAMRDRGDYPTLAGAVCVLKQAARMAANNVAQKL